VIQVKLYGPLREVVRSESLEASGDWNVADALHALCGLHPKLKPLLFENGKLASHFVVLVDGQNIWSSRGLDTPVGSAKVMSLVFPIEGG
jgi:molybdopterin converting factor small subunit